MATRIISIYAFQFRQNLPKRVYKHIELTIDTNQPPEITLRYEEPDSLAPYKSALEIKNDYKPVRVKLAGAVKIKKIENFGHLATVGIDYGRNKIGVFTPKTSVTLYNDCDFWEKLKALLPKEPYQIVVGLPYQQYSPNIGAQNTSVDCADKNHLFYLPQILTCIDFASTLVTNLYNYYCETRDFQTNDQGQGVCYICRCQLCLIKGKHKSTAHPSDIICPEKFEIIDTTKLLVPPVFLSSESYSSTNSDVFSKNISYVKKFRRMDIHARSSCLIALGFEQNPHSSFYSLPSGNSLPLETGHRRLYLKALTKIAKRMTL